MDCKVSGAFLCLSVFSAGILAEPFAVRDQNPLALIQGLTLPASARLPEAGQFGWSMNLNITNTLNTENTVGESILLDYESHELLTRLSLGLSEGWALKLDLPLIHYGGGLLDNTIEGWHQTFGLPNAERANYPANAFRLNYQSSTNTVVDIDTASNSLADIQFGVGKQLVQTGRQATSLWLTLDLPTGSQSKLSGSESTDIILQLASVHRLRTDWQLDAELALLLPGASTLNTAPVAERVWSAQSGIEWRAQPGFELRLQVNAHTRIYPDSALAILGNSYQLVFGGRMQLENCADVAISVSEDIKSGTAPDVSFGFSYRQHAGC